MTLWWIPPFSNQSTKAPPALPTGKTKIPSYIRHLDDRTLTVALPTTLGAIAPIWPGTPHTVLAIGKSCWILGKWWLTWCKNFGKGHALQLTSSCELGKKNEHHIALPAVHLWTVAFYSRCFFMMTPSKQCQIQINYHLVSEFESWFPERIKFYEFGGFLPLKTSLSELPNPKSLRIRKLCFHRPCAINGCIEIICPPEVYQFAPEKLPSHKGKQSSNHPFSGANCWTLGGVPNPHLWWEVFHLKRAPKFGTPSSASWWFFLRPHGWRICCKSLLDQFPAGWG